MSDLNIVDSSTKLFSIDKPIIEFEINRNNNDIQEVNINNSISSHYPIKLGNTSILVTNLTSEYISLRTKTTKKQYYSLDPSYCNIAPNSEQKLDFKYFIKAGEQVSNSGHKFKFEAFVISPEEKDQDSKILFNKYISQKIPVKASLIKTSVKFIEKDIVDKETNGIHSNNIKNNLNHANDNNNINHDMNNNINHDMNNNINNYSNFYISENVNNNINDETNSNKSNNKIIKGNNNNEFIENNQKTNSKNNSLNTINTNNIKKEKTKETIINEEEKTIETKINNNLPKIDINKLPLNDTNNKNKSLIIDNSFNQKKESNENKLFLSHNKSKFDSYSNKDFGTPKKKRFLNTSNKYSEFDNPKTEEENAALLNNLKVEYYKLKNELDNLIERYYNLRNHVDLEEDNRDLNVESNSKNKYVGKKTTQIRLSQNICIVLCIFAVLLGFYLS